MPVNPNLPKHIFDIMDQDGNKWLSGTELEQLDVSVAAGLAERHQLKRSALARAQARSSEL